MQASLGSWGQEVYVLLYLTEARLPQRSAQSSLNPVGEGNKVCGLEKEEEAKAAAANGNAV